MNGSMVKNHISLKTGFGFLATRRTSFLLWFQACQIRLQDLIHQLQGHSQDKESHCSTSSSSSSSSPTVSDTKNREREDRTESDISPVTVSTTVDQANKNRKTKKKEPKRERGDPLCADSGRARSEIPEWLQEFRENLVDDEIPEHGDSHASSSHEASLEPITKRREDLGKHKVHTQFPKTEIARSVNGPKLQGPHAEDAMAKPYLEL